MDTSRISGADQSMDSHDGSEQGMHTMMVTPELMGMLPGPSKKLGSSAHLGYFCCLNKKLF